MYEYIYFLGKTLKTISWDHDRLISWFRVWVLPRTAQFSKISNGNSPNKLVSHDGKDRNNGLLFVRAWNKMVTKHYECNINYHLVFTINLQRKPSSVFCLNRSLAKVSYRIKVYPVRVPTENIAKKAWFLGKLKSTSIWFIAPHHHPTQIVMF